MSDAVAGEVAAGTAAAPRRLVALDAFRGATIAAMILVNNPGSWSHVYAPLRHAEWHGWTPTDLIFPFFLFIVGVAIALALGRRLDGAAGGGAGVGAAATRGAIVRKVLRRSVVLFALGLLLAAWPGIVTDPLDTLAHLRIPGVLQRIAICYAAVSLGYVWLRDRPRLLFALAMPALLLGYWALMTLVPVPGQPGGGSIDQKDTHLAAWLDRLVLGEQHLWRAARTWDPEGILSTLPAFATTLFGLLAGCILRSERRLEHKLVELFAVGTLLVAVGSAWGWVFPINKPIWTSSYAVLTAGQAMCALALCVYACDLRGFARWAAPFVTYGVNAITVFVGSGLLARTLSAIEVGGAAGGGVDGSGTAVSLRTWIYRNGFESWVDGEHASLAYAVCWVLMWYAALRWMQRRGIVIRV